MAADFEKKQLQQELLELQSLVSSFQIIFQDKSQLQLDGLAILGPNMCKYPKCAFRTHYPQALMEHELKGEHYNFSTHQLTENHTLKTSCVSFSVPNSEKLCPPVFEGFPDLSTYSELTGIGPESVANNIDPELNFGSTLVFLDSNASSFMENRSVLPAVPARGYGKASKYFGGPSGSSKPFLAKRSARLTCDTCFKQFTRAETLRDHLLSHKDIRPFPCGICGIAFARLKDRKRHESKHSAEKIYVCGQEHPENLKWGCGRQFSREDGLTAHFRSETGGACLMPLLDANEFFRFLRTSNDGLIVCEDAPERGKQGGCGAKFDMASDMRKHFELSGPRSCIRQIMIRFAMGLLRASRNSIPPLAKTSTKGSLQKQILILEEPSLIPWHPSAINEIPGELGMHSMHKTVADGTELNWTEIAPYDLHISHTEPSIESAALENINIIEPQKPVTMALGTQLQSIIDEVDSSLMDKFKTIPSQQQFIALSHRAGSQEGINALIVIVISPYSLKDNKISIKFGAAKCEATWSTVQQPESSRSLSSCRSTWYEHSISATVPQFTTTHSQSTIVKLGLLIEHVSGLSGDLNGSTELEIGEFSYYSVLS